MLKLMKIDIFTLFGGVLFGGVSMATLNMQTDVLSIVLVTMAYCLYYVSVNHTKYETSSFQIGWGRKRLLSTLALCFWYRVNVFLSDVIKRIYSAFIMQRNVTCQVWFLKMYSLPLADELRSLQFLHINTVNRPMSFRVLVQLDVSVSYQAQ